MSSIIDRYLYDVTRRLPENMRDDVEQELRANIEDMLPDNPTEEEIENVLESLGAPSKLAAKYRPNPRYLISPALFEEYISVLKIVAVVLALPACGAEYPENRHRYGFLQYACRADCFHHHGHPVRWRHRPCLCVFPG